MTPEEQQLVNELFARLVQLEGTPRDPEAERLIADGTKKAPNAAYALVQTTLVQDEALKRANARIEELQEQLADAGQSQRRQGGFLNSMRDALLGSNGPQASEPTVRPRSTQFGSAGTPGAEPQPGFSVARDAGGIAAQPNFPAGPTFGSGGSFLGTAAAAAAGVIGGGLLRSMFGHRSGFTGSDRVASGGHSQDSAGDNNLARQDGADDIDQNHIDQDQQDDEDFGDDDTYADDDTDDV
jgi:uncharacterized protein